MHILVHDFAGHAFQIQLSRELAARGHAVVHVYPTGLPGPKGSLAPRPEDPASLKIVPLPLSGFFRKYSPAKRMLAQRRYAADMQRLIYSERPDVVLSGNTPIDVQFLVQRYCKQNRVAFVHWVQDVYCEALAFFLKRRFGGASRLVSAPFRWMERSVAKGSDGIVVIAGNFCDVLAGMGVCLSRVNVIENWAPLDEVQLASHDNAWRRSLGLDTRPIFLYSGTLGLKHRPELLYKLAGSLAGAAYVVVVSEGVGRNHLQALPGLENLKFIDFQPYERLGEVLGAADVLLATLEPDAGPFAVPSKVLAYLCAGRPVLLAAPTNNLSSQIIRSTEAGLAVDPSDDAAWISAARRLASDAEFRLSSGRRARAYAEATFDIGRVATAFEVALSAALPCERLSGAPEPTMAGIN
jgi:glycosyltransferase involved in cell wall biosynthesis